MRPAGKNPQQDGGFCDKIAGQLRAIWAKPEPPSCSLINSAPRPFIPRARTRTNDGIRHLRHANPLFPPPRRRTRCRDPAAGWPACRCGRWKCHGGRAAEGQSLREGGKAFGSDGKLSGRCRAVPEVRLRVVPQRGRKSGGLITETPELLRKGGTKFGKKIIVPGNAARSILIAYMRGTKQPRMPLGGEPVAKRRFAWSSAGSPRARGLTPPRSAGLMRPDCPHCPAGEKRGVGDEPDRPFVAGEAGGEGLTPAAARRQRDALLRRVYDLTGLPPTPPNEVDAFLADRSPDAYEKLVDRLLASPALRRAVGAALARRGPLRRDQRLRARQRPRRTPGATATTSSRSFNADKPYDRFVQRADRRRRALADGDRRTRLIATGFHRLGPEDGRAPTRSSARHGHRSTT